MNKVVLFFITVIGGTLLILLLLNQKELTSNSTISATPTIPPLSLNQPNNGSFQKAKSETITPTISPTISPTVTQTLNQVVETATIKTTKGDIVLTLYGKDAPNTVNNFVTKAKNGFYQNLIFHRVEDWVIQGGDPKGNGMGGGNMVTELNDKPFVVGSLGVARGGDIRISNDAQFFITKKDAPWLNNQYTNFGIVTKGMDVVNKMEIGDKILGILTE